MQDAGWVPVDWLSGYGADLVWVLCFDEICKELEPLYLLQLYSYIDFIKKTPGFFMRFIWTYCPRKTLCMY